MNKEEFTGVILAGGDNSRMGTDKGLLLVNGVRIVERIIEAMAQVTGEIMIISNGNKYDYLGYKVYADSIKGCGPMGGIYTALCKSTTQKNLVTSCDMPFLTTAALKFIIENSDDCDVAVPEHDSKIEPLCAVYSKYCKTKFKQILANGQLKLREALKDINTKRIVFQNVDEAKKLFMNINTREEYEGLNYER